LTGLELVYWLGVGVPTTPKKEKGGQHRSYLFGFGLPRRCYIKRVSSMMSNIPAFNEADLEFFLPVFFTFNLPKVLLIS